MRQYKEYILNGRFLNVLEKFNFCITLLSGIAGIILASFWIVFIRDTPEDSKRISDVEKKYIGANVPRKDESTELVRYRKIRLYPVFKPIKHFRKIEWRISYFTKKQTLYMYLQNQRNQEHETIWVNNNYSQTKQEKTNIKW